MGTQGAYVLRYYALRICGTNHIIKVNTVNKKLFWSAI